MRRLDAWTFRELVATEGTSTNVRSKKWSTYNVTMFTIGLLSALLATTGIVLASLSAAGVFSGGGSALRIYVDDNNTIVVQPADSVVNVTLNASQ